MPRVQKRIFCSLQTEHISPGREREAAVVSLSACSRHRNVRSSTTPDHTSSCSMSGTPVLLLRLNTTIPSESVSEFFIFSNFGAILLIKQGPARKTDRHQLRGEWHQIIVELTPLPTRYILCRLSKTPANISALIRIHTFWAVATSICYGNRNTVPLESQLVTCHPVVVLYIIECSSYCILSV